MNATVQRFDELVHGHAASARMHDDRRNAREHVFDAVVKFGDQQVLGHGRACGAASIRDTAAWLSAMALRNSVRVELGLLFLVFILGQWLWRSETALDIVTWYATPQGGHLHLTGAGYWYAFVSIPIF